MTCKTKKVFKTVFIIILAIIMITGIYAISINLYIVGSQKDKILTDFNGQKFDCIIVLGCGVRSDGTPSTMLYNRIIEGVRLYKENVAPIIIMSGDHGKQDYDEVNTMKDYAIKLGVPKEKIFLDHAGFSTYESVYRAKEIFGVDSCVFVSQEYHLSRTLYCAKNFGINAFGSAAEDVASGQTLRDVREIIARNKDFLYCVFEPKPKYLGNKISLDSDPCITYG